MFSIRVTSIAYIVAAMLVADISYSQQPQSPSQRFEPVRNVPPNVHVPPNGAARNLRAAGQKSRPQAVTTYNFSDTDRAAFENNVRQVTYQQPVNPQVPPILQSPDTKTPIETFDSAPMTLESLRPPTATDTPVAAQPISEAATNTANEPNHQIVVDHNQFASDPVQVADAENRLRQVAYVADGDPTQRVAHTMNTQPEDADPVHSAAAISATDDHQTSLRQVTANTDVGGGASVNLSTPGLVVQSFGPDAIGINKLSTYKVTVSNNSNQDAGKIIVGVQIPESVELQNLSTTIGRHELTDGVDQPRLLWTLDHVAARTTHTLGITAIPRTADPFDMQVQWSFAPQVGSTHIRVTEPQLEMKISGPTELLYGEKAIYDVTISNPGTGTAEQVTIALPEALGGEREVIGNITAGGEKRFNVELSARTAGQLSLTTSAFADGNIKATANHDIIVRRANLSMEIEGPPMKYAGSVGQYKVTIANNGDATATDVVGIIALPNGVKYISGVNNAQASDSGLKWTVGTLTAGDQREFNVNCQLDASGDLMLQAGARGAGDLAATSQCQTTVETIADLVLSVEDPKGPLPTGDEIQYRIRVKNRGTRTANGVNLVMQFSEGIEPVKADGFRNKITTGQVIFDPITRIEPGQEISLNVTAQAIQSGTHIFRAQLTCPDSDSREIAEGTTRFFGENVQIKGQEIDVPFKANTADADTSSGKDFK